MRKISILGLVLMGASAVTAAVLPSKSNDKSSDNNLDRFAAGSLTQNSSIPNGVVASSVTCAPDTANLNNNCNASTGAGTETTGGGGTADSTSVSSAFEVGGGLGANNTTDAG